MVSTAGENFVDIFLLGGGGEKFIRNRLVGMVRIFCVLGGGHHDIFNFKKYVFYRNFEVYSESFF